MKVTDALLARYAAEARDLWLGTLPPDASHTFSHRFRRKMKRLLAEQRRSPAMNRAVLIARRTAAALLVAASLTAASLLSVEAYREKFIEVVTEFFDDLTEFRFSGFADDGAPMPEVTLTYVPEGMEETEREEDEISAIIIFRNREGQRMILQQEYITQSVVSTLIVDTEDAEVEYAQIHGHEVMVITKDGGYHLLWTQDAMRYLLSGNVPLDELIKVVEGIQQAPQKNN